MFTSSLKFPLLVNVPQFQTPAAQERLGYWLGILLGLFFSPSWFMLKSVLAYYLPLDTLFHNGMNAPAALAFVTHLEALGPSILLGQLVPILLICQVVSLTFLYGCGCLGRAVARLFGKTRQSRPA